MLSLLIQAINLSLLILTPSCAFWLYTHQRVSPLVWLQKQSARTSQPLFLLQKRMVWSSW